MGGKTIMRRFLISLMLMLTAASAGAGEVKFSLKLDTFDWSPKMDAQTKARLAQWNDPMGRLLHAFNQQQAWIMRGTMPGGERVSGVAVRIKAQNGLPLNLVASTIQGGIEVARTDLVNLGRRRGDDDELDLMTLEEHLSRELGKKLVPK
ncbi:MAG: hypothetical protein LJE93_11265 [Acidobacteria bacterium]|nr:hypothetical protein [Acidobacteriota bacterium]